MAQQVQTGTAEANGATLYYELRGSGPALLLISGAEGDAEEYARVAPLLEDQFTILSYDRRGFSRSPRPAGYAGTTVEEQADDAAALLAALGMEPVDLWGNSSGAIIGLALALRHPEAVRKAMLHEPPLFAGMADYRQVPRLPQGGHRERQSPFPANADRRRRLQQLLPGIPGSPTGRRHLDHLRVQRVRVLPPDGRRAGDARRSRSRCSMVRKARRSLGKPPDGWPAAWGPKRGPFPAATAPTTNCRKTWPRP